MEDANFNDNPKSLEIEEIEIKKNMKLSIFLAPGGGVAISIKRKRK